MIVERETLIRYIQDSETQEEMLISFINDALLTCGRSSSTAAAAFHTSDLIIWQIDYLRWRPAKYPGAIMSITRNTLLSISNRWVTSPSGQGRLFGCHGLPSDGRNSHKRDIYENNYKSRDIFYLYVIKSCIMFYMKLYIKVRHKVVKDIKVQFIHLI